ncbi:MAG TPA: NADPH-dependent F420 reductase [Vicinamibacterales bacterium]
MSTATLAVLGGTGRQGRGIVRRFAQAGFRVLVGSRDPERAAAAVAKWPDATPAISAVNHHDAIVGASVVFLAVPFDSLDGLIADNRGAFSPRCLVVDVTVPLLFSGGPLRLSAVPGGSAAEYIRARLPPEVRLAVAFKTLPARLLGSLDEPLDCDEFIAGDSQESRNEIAALMQHIKGLRAVDVGPLSNARSIEHLTLLAIGINRRYEVHAARFQVVGL